MADEKNESKAPEAAAGEAEVTPVEVKGAAKPPAIGHLPIEDFMEKKVVQIDGQTTVRQAIELLIKEEISGVPVVDQNGNLVSVVTEFDLMQFAAKGNIDSPLGGLLSKLVPKDKLLTVRKGDAFKEAFKWFLTRNVRRVLVIGPTGKVEGIVARRDILRAFLMNSEKETKKAA